MWSFWQVDNVVGYFAGNVIPAAWSLEFTVPLCFVALLAPALEEHAADRGRWLVAGVAVLALDALPMRLNLVAAGVLGIVAGTVRRSSSQGTMEGALKLWVVIVVVGAINYSSRLSFIAFFARRTMPPLLARALRYVPAAMLTALIVPMIVAPAVGASSRSIRKRPGRARRRRGRVATRSTAEDARRRHGRAVGAAIPDGLTNHGCRTESARSNEGGRIG